MLHCSHCTYASSSSSSQPTLSLDRSFFLFLGNFIPFLCLNRAEGSKFALKHTSFSILAYKAHLSDDNSVFKVTKQQNFLLCAAAAAARQNLMWKVKIRLVYFLPVLTSKVA